jgi:hypothetical protein
MIKTSGTLTVKSITGRNGAFSVGKLVTPVGEFSVKDTILDQYPEGKYEGEFLISRIFPYSYIMRGTAMVEVRVILDQILIDVADETPQPPELPIADPLEEQGAPVAEAKPADEPVGEATGDGESDKKTGDELAEVDITSEENRQDYSLFGPDLYQELMLELGVKLDPTVDRVRFRSQRDRLKELGYKFIAESQTWQLP